MKKLVACCPTIYGKQIKCKNSKKLKTICDRCGCPNLSNIELLEYIDNCTKDCIDDYSFSFKLYWTLMELQDYPTCDFGHRIEPKKSFRLHVDPMTLEVSSTLAKRCNDPHCA